MIKTLKNRFLFQAIFFIICVFSFWSESQGASARRGEIITVKTGDHQYFIRFVLVTSVPVKVRVQNNRNKRLVKLELSRALKTNLMHKMQKISSNFRRQQLISGWDLSVKSGRSIVTVKLARPAEIKSIFTLPPEKKQDHYRVVLDIYDCGPQSTIAKHADQQSRSTERSEKPLKGYTKGHTKKTGILPQHIVRSVHASVHAQEQEKTKLITTQNQQIETDNRDQTKASSSPERSAMKRAEPSVMKQGEAMIKQGDAKGLADTTSQPISTVTPKTVIKAVSISVPLPAPIPSFKKNGGHLAQASGTIGVVSFNKRKQLLGRGKQTSDVIEKDAIEKIDIIGKAEKGGRSQENDLLVNKQARDPVVSEEERDLVVHKDDPVKETEEAINDLGLTESEMEEVYGPPKVPDVAQVEKEPLPLLQAPSSARKLIIVIDAGHGGKDTGAISPQGYFEKNITLSFAREIRNVLNASQRYHAILTRTKDEAIPLRERFAIARDVGAHLFISLHVDSSPKKSLQGFSVYTLSAVASDQEAQKLAAIENKADLLTNIDLSHNCPETAAILVNLSQRDTMNRSIQFADCLIKSATGLCKLPVQAHRFADFAVLKAPDVPSVLIELGYLSNPEDTARLMNKNYQKKFAQVIVKAIDTFFESIAKDKD